MGFSGGSYTRTDGVRSGTDVFAQQKSASVKITASLMDAHANDMATALSTCVLKDGSQTITANIPFGSNRITGLAAGTAATDGANVQQLQNSAPLWGGTSGGTANAHTISLTPNLGAYAAGQRFSFISGAVNTATATLNIDSLGAKTIKTIQGDALQGYELTAGDMFEVIYDGTDFILLGAHSATAWTPSYSASGSMTFTSVTTNHADFFRMGHWLFFSLKATGTVGGTPSTDIYFTVPTNHAPEDDAMGAGEVEGAAGIWYEQSSTQLAVRVYDFSNYSAGSNSIWASGFYKVA